jgi:hypothetical protein
MSVVPHVYPAMTLDQALACDLPLLSYARASRRQSDTTRRLAQWYIICQLGAPLVVTHSVVRPVSRTRQV